ncbi:hypothetical protein F442_04564 [Phytophthora nicotianae P10297]|uniref:Uncharacterized protein n=1 Tax=Phytophthora nicotianae P10297 TaxID=1317064 RepID=W2ZRL5_PHYNI|nr:hypothetical protein F442_04564 [Phytophthora nicotianae P10297]
MDLSLLLNADPRIEGIQDLPPLGDYTTPSTVAVSTALHYTIGGRHKYSYDAVDAVTAEELELKRGEMNRLCPVLSSYLDNHWWKYKGRIVRAWTDRYQHFGIRYTLFVEGTHAKCKNIKNKEFHLGFGGMLAGDR